MRFSSKFYHYLLPAVLLLANACTESQKQSEISKLPEAEEDIFRFELMELVQSN
jgi:hypothetical protein